LIKNETVVSKIRFSWNGFIKEFYLYINVLSTCPDAVQTS